MILDLHGCLMRQPGIQKSDDEFSRHLRARADQGCRRTCSSRCWPTRSRSGSSCMLRRRGRAITSPSETRWTLVVAAVIGGGARVRRSCITSPRPRGWLENWRDPVYPHGRQDARRRAASAARLLVELVKKVQRCDAAQRRPLCPAALHRHRHRANWLLPDRRARRHCRGRDEIALTGMDLGDGLMRHPTPLYEIAFMVLLGAAIMAALEAAISPCGRFALRSSS